MTFEANWGGDPLGRFRTGEESEAAVELAQLMSDISERCWAAGWEHNTEEALWSALTHGPTKWGRGFIEADDILSLKSLSDRCGGWIVDLPGGPSFMLMKDWIERYEGTQTNHS